jgi:hypothetical protein
MNFMIYGLNINLINDYANTFLNKRNIGKYRSFVNNC